MNIPITVLEPFGVIGIPALFSNGHWEMDNIMMAVDDYAKSVQRAPQYASMLPQTHASNMRRLAEKLGAKDAKVDVVNDGIGDQFLYIIVVTVGNDRGRYTVAMEYPVVEY